MSGFPRNSWVWSRVVSKPGSATHENHHWRLGGEEKDREKGREEGERLSLPHSEVVLSRLPGLLAPSQLSWGWQLPWKNTTAGHPRCWSGVPTRFPPSRGGGVGGEHQNRAGSGGSRGNAGDRG